jgi:hypothetical protein
MNANKGYIGWSESVRSAKAKLNGELPKSLFKKEYKLSEKTFQKFLSDGLIVKSSWHHTSKYFNKTDFYSFTNDGLFFMDLITYDEYVKSEFYIEPKQVKFPFEYTFNNQKRCDCFVIDNYLYPIHNTLKDVNLWTGKSIDGKKIRLQIDTYVTKTGKIGQIVLESNL